MIICRAMVLSLALVGPAGGLVAQEPAPGGYPGSIVRGRSVKVERGSSGPLRGELLSVSADSLWVLTRPPWEISSVSLDRVRTVRVRRGSGMGKALVWSLVGAAVTGTALTAACSSVEEATGCGVVFPLVALGWGVVGGWAGAAMAGASQVKVVIPDVDVLRPYARYPQGPPPDVRRNARRPPGSGGADPP